MILPGQIYRDPELDSTVRVLLVHSPISYVLKLPGPNDPPYQPSQIVFPHVMLSSLLEPGKGYIQIEELLSAELNSRRAYAELNSEEFNARKETYLPFFTSNLESLCMKRARPTLIKQFSSSAEISVKTIERVLTGYFMFGLDPLGLVPNFAKCGGKGKERSSVNFKDPSFQARIISDAWKLRIRRFLDDKYGEAADADGLYLRFRHQYALTKVGSREHVCPPDFPKIHQFHYQLSKYRKLNNLLAPSRTLPNEKIKEPTLRETPDSKEHLWGYLQIDATTADIFLRSNFSAYCVGKPTVLFALCCVTHAIVGIYVTLWDESYTTLTRLLENVLTPKDEWFRNFGLTGYDKSDWPSSGFIPKGILTDRGPAYTSQNSTALIEKLAITINHCRSYSPELKGLVESHFAKIRGARLKWLDGATFGRVERGRQYTKTVPTLTVDDFTRELILLGIEWNHRSRKDLTPTPLQIEKGMRRTPISYWDYCCGALTINFKQIHLPDFRLRALSTDKTRTLHKYKITRERLKFAIPYELRPSYRTTKPVSICLRYNQQNITETYLDPGGGRPLIKLALINSLRFKDIVSWNEWREFSAFLNTRDVSDEQKLMDLKLMHHARSDVSGKSSLTHAKKTEKYAQNQTRPPIASVTLKQPLKPEVDFPTFE